MIRGKSICIVDDSIVRGTTITGIIKLLRKSGAAQVHLRIASPPLVSPCYLGVDIERHKELVAHHRSVEQIRKKIGADSLGYISLSGLRRAIGRIKYGFCTGCFTGEYPVNLER
jgi:amidophosphoribosyltransferase